MTNSTVYLCEQVNRNPILKRLLTDYSSETQSANVVFHYYLTTNINP